MLRIVRNVLSRLSPEHRTIAKGLISYVPGVFRFADVTDSVSARYCYATWLKHLTLAYDSGMNTDPKTVVEIGPGSSLGQGVTALLLGAHTYHALDVFPHAKEQPNLRIFDEVISLITNRADIWHEKSRETRPFPGNILMDERLEWSMGSARVESIRGALQMAFVRGRPSRNNQMAIHYICPWTGVEALEPESSDMIVSTGVLQAVEDLPELYRCFRTWLKAGGFMSHFVDFSSYGMTEQWNGHWGCPSLVWRLMKGNRPYLHNRAPHSVHRELLEQNGFVIVCDVQTTNYSGLQKEDLAPEFRYLSDEDLITSGAYMQAMKPGEASTKPMLARDKEDDPGHFETSAVSP